MLCFWDSDGSRPEARLLFLVTGAGALYGSGCLCGVAEAQMSGFSS
jgi:hypothetical protein